MSKMIEIIEFGRVYGEPGNVQWIDLYVNLQNSGISGVGKESLILSTWARVLFSSLLLPDPSPLQAGAVFPQLQLLHVSCLFVLLGTNSAALPVSCLPLSAGIGGTFRLRLGAASPILTASSSCCLGPFPCHPSVLLYFKQHQDHAD